MKKVLFFIFITLFKSVLAYDFKSVTPSGHTLCYSIYGNTAAIVPLSYKQPPSELSGSIIVPDKVWHGGKEYSIKHIGYYAFYGFNDLIQISVPSSVMYIDDYAFCHCCNLVEANLGTGIVSIGNYAFNGCTRLASLEIPDVCSKIGKNALGKVLKVVYNGNASGNPWGASTISRKSTVTKATGGLVPIYSDIASARQYLEENLANLDPIEGIYSVDVNMTIVVDDYLQPVSQGVIEMAIVKSGSQFDVIYTGSSGIKSMAISRIGETYAYDLTVVFAASNRVIRRINLESLYEFEAKIVIPNDVIQQDVPSLYNMEAHMKLNFVKKFPTQSMYEKVISQKSTPSSWTGTGFAIGSGYLVTNYHVAEDATNISIKGVRGNFNLGYSAEVVATDKVNDIAVLKINDNRFKGFGKIPYAVSSRMADVGEDIFVLGYPLTQTMGDEIKLTNGIISSRSGFKGDVANYQMSAPIQPGNSGGPMFDSKGNVIGIVCAHHSSAENAGYAIKISYLKLLIESAGLKIPFPNNNTISSLSLSEKVKRAKNFVYFIECSR